MTLNEVYLKYQVEKEIREFADCSRAWLRKVGLAIKRVVAAIMKERRISFEEVKRLPGNTILGPISEAAANEFFALLATGSEWRNK
ncbi:MAG TPA: hypothetical protein VMX18_00320 [Candidatus Bipolaricaulota bacterium]|nr:hypothetical protein [Candidatus Bipolaricaulota bacterium]